MKKLLSLILFTLIVSSSQAQNTTPTIGQVFNTIADMKLQMGNNNTVVYVTGGSALSDYRGAFYVWDSTSTATEDMTSFNVIQVTGVNTGRWIRTNQSIQNLPQGTLFRIGPLKILAASGITNASGEFTLNATIDNTSGGTAIFSTILFNATQATSGSSNANDAVIGTVKSVTSGKVIVYRYTKGNTIGLLGAVSIVLAPASIPVQCFVVGI